MKSPARIFVVDADIARAAGPDPKTRAWPDSAKAAHDVLAAIWQCHGFKAAFDPTLRDEWDRHQGRTAKAWFARMLAASRIRVVQHATREWVDQLIAQHLPPAQHEAASKDAHLVALAHDPGDDRLLSNDNRARDRFHSLPDERVRQIHWANASEDTRQWLLDGAYDRPAWRLGHVEAAS